MKKSVLKCLALAFLMPLSSLVHAQSTPTLYHGWWQGRLLRTDGQDIVFNFEVKDSATKTILYIRNAGEKLLVDQVSLNGDSVNIHMPFFESSFRASIQPDGSLQGVYVRKGAVGERLQPFIAFPHTVDRFALSNGPASVHVEGRYAVRFINDKGFTQDTAVGEFSQRGNSVTGTFLTPTGDYRFLEGVVTGDSLKVSTFDGSHAFVFSAKVGNDRSLHGKLYAGAAPSSGWEGVFNAQASLPEGAAVAKLVNKDSTQLHFRFPDMDSNLVSINDARFKGKVVVITIMGSWCPNCMDETHYLSAWYDQNHSRGVEILGLAYERTTDFQRSKLGLQTFKDRFDVHYPFLITGVTVGDPEKTPKTLPQLDAIKAFPSMLILDKKGNVRIIRAGFEGPGTGDHYLQFQKQFNNWIDQLLNEEG
jgi:thiol-disulfide isomerase/thioredoxin